MQANDYHLVSHWRVHGTVQEVTDILADATSLPSWWGSVYREVEQTAVGDALGVGKVFKVRAQGWLPYSLRLEFTETEQHSPGGFTLAVTGDLNGAGVWTFEQNEEHVDIAFDWTVSAEKVIVRRFSAALKPIFSSNHHWTMRRGEQSLRLELARRRAQTPEERAQVPDPPGPFAIHPGILVIGAATAIAAVAVSRVGLFRRRGRE